MLGNNSNAILNRHYEWGGTRGYNAMLASWEAGEPTLTAGAVHNCASASADKERTKSSGGTRKRELGGRGQATEGKRHKGT